MLAVDPANRPFAMLVYDHQKLPLEPVRKMKVKRATEILRPVDQFVLISKPLVQIRRDTPEGFSDDDLRDRRLSAVQYVADELEAERSAAVFEELEISSVGQVESYTEPFDELGDTRQVIGALVVAPAHPNRSGGIEIVLALTRPKHDSLRDPAANDAALGQRDTRLVAFQSRGRDPIEALRYANGGQIPAVDQPTDRVVADTESLGGFLDRVVALSDDFSPAIDALR